MDQRIAELDQLARHKRLEPDRGSTGNGVTLEILRQNLDELRCSKRELNCDIRLYGLRERPPRKTGT